MTGVIIGMYSREHPMTELFYVTREWNQDSPGEYTKTFTLDQLTTMSDILGEDIRSEEFTYFLTGLTNDSYSDSMCEDLEETYNCYSDSDEEEYKYKNTFTRCMEQEYFLTCWTVFRLWNLHLTREQCLEQFETDCVDTLKGMVDS